MVIIKNKKGGLAISQILVLVIGIVAIAYAIGSSVGFVSALTPGAEFSYGSLTFTVINDNHIVSGSNHYRYDTSHCTAATSTGSNWYLDIDNDENFGDEEYAAAASGTNICMNLAFVTAMEGAQVPSTGEGESSGEASSGGETGSSIANLVIGGSVGAVTKEIFKNLYEKFTGTTEEVVEDAVTDAVGASADSGANVVTNEIIDTATSGGSGKLRRAFDFLSPGEGGEGAEFFAPSNVNQYFGYAGIAAVVMALIQFTITIIKTGDSGRAFDSALRVGGAVAVGYLAGAGITQILVLTGVSLGPVGWITTAAITAAVWASQFLIREQQRMAIFQCTPWQAQTGGDDCSLCNDGPFPCTEYQCKSLGAGCELVNKDTDDPRCVYSNSQDLTPPEITVWEDALTEGYSYDPLPQGQTGVEIKYGDQDCLPAFTPFTFGITLDKEGYCVLDFQRTDDFSEMRFDFGGSNSYKMEHTHQMAFPGVANLEQEGTELTNGGEFELYTRCESVNGESNREEFLFKFCIEQGPDTEYPRIRGFNWNDESPIAYFAEGEEREVNVQVYVNEPAECKWDHEDKDYENMENELSCPSNSMSFNAQLSYTCNGKLTGLENGKENKFYFKCKDLSINNNINPISKTLTLTGTQQLVIDKVSPDNELIRGSSNSIKVTLEAETSAGYDEGRAICSYSNTGITGSYVPFSNTDSYKHSTNIWLIPGSYTYYVKCVDLGGNSDIKTISYDVESDLGYPLIVRAYSDGGSLKIITNEPAKCVYDTEYVSRPCDYLFEDGISMSTSDDLIHSVGWDTNNNLYIICQDEYGNQPASGCSIILRPFEFF